MNNYYNVIDYGAQGNGLVNDTNAIQLAVNAALSNGGGRVYLPPGRYLVSSVTLPAGIILYGAGALTSTLVASQATGDVLSVAGAGVSIKDLGFATFLFRLGGSYVNFLAGCYDCSLDHFRMEGGWVSIDCASAATTWIEHGSIRNFSHAGIHSTGGDIYYRCLTMDNDPSGPEPLAGIMVESGGCTISDCNIIRSGNDLLITGAFSVYAQNTFFDTARCGVRILAQTPVERCHFVGCWTSSHLEHGFLIDPGSTGQVTNILIEGHQSFFNKLNGIYLGTGNHLLVSTSQVNQNGSGLFAGPATKRVLVSGNDCLNNGSQNLVVLGAPQIVANNFS